MITTALSAAIAVALILAALRLKEKSALVFLIVASHIDFSGPEFDAQSSIGVLNLITATIPPLILAIRMSLLRSRWTPASILLLAYCITLLFHVEFAGHFGLALIKYVVYVALYGLVAFLCVTGHRKFGLQDQATLRVLTYVPLGLALIQTFLLGGGFGTADGRFTSFSSPQSFALYCLGIAALTLASSLNLPQKLELTSTLMLMVFLSGSRSALFGATVMLMMWLLLHVFNRRRSTALFAFSTLLCAVVGAAFVLAFPKLLTVNRSTDALRQILSGNGDLSTIGTFDFRSNVSTTAWGMISDASSLQILFGLGFGAAALAVLATGSRANIDNIDPNRALHNEYLRVLLESGLLGSVLLWSALLGLVVFTSRVRISSAVFYMSGPLLIGLALENILVGSSSPSGWGIMLAITASAATRSWSAEREPPKLHRYIASGQK